MFLDALNGSTSETATVSSTETTPTKTFSFTKLPSPRTTRTNTFDPSATEKKYFLTSFKAKKVWPKLPTLPAQKAPKSKAPNTPQIDETTTPEGVAGEAEADPPGLDLTITTTKNTKSLKTARLKKNELSDQMVPFEVEAGDEVEAEEVFEVEDEAEEALEVLTEEALTHHEKAKKAKKLPTPKTTRTVNKLKATDPDQKLDEAVTDHEVVSGVEAEEPEVAEAEEVEDEAGPATKASLATKMPPLQLLLPLPQPLPLQPPLLQPPQRPRHQKLKTKLFVSSNA